MRIVLIGVIALATFVPNSVMAESADKLYCVCTIKGAMLKESALSKAPGDIAAADIAEFIVQDKDEEGKLTSTFVYPKGGLDNGEVFDPLWAANTFISGISINPKITINDESKGEIEYEGIGKLHPFPKDIKLDTGKKLFIAGTTSGWPVDFTKTGTDSGSCVPKTVTDLYTGFVVPMGDGYGMMNLTCEDYLEDDSVIPDESESGSGGTPGSGTDTGTHDSGEGHVDGVPGGGGNGLGGLAIQSKLDPIGTSLQVLFGRLIKIGLSILGSVALVIFIYGGFLWMTAMGNAEQSKKAFSTLLWGALGVIVILASYGIVDFVLHSFK